MTKWFPTLFNRDRSVEMADPFSALQQEINRLFEDFTRWPTPRLLAGFPLLDMSETEKSLDIQVELPGLTDKDVEVVVEDDKLVIRGHSETEREDKPRGYHIKERTAGAFERRLTLPFVPDPTKVQANFAKGGLNISIEKTAETKPAGVKVAINEMA